MNTVLPCVALVKEPEAASIRVLKALGLDRCIRKLTASPRWKVELRNFRRVDEVLGRDVLNGFCRCFIHADRLTSTISCLYSSEQFHGRNSKASSRDLISMVWFTVGTLREMALAVRDLRAALARRGSFDPNSAPWKRLREIEQRWEDDEFFRNMRNLAAFHIDRGVIDKGLAVLVRDDPNTVLCEGDGRKSVRTLLTLGEEALFNGFEIDLATYREFVEKVGDDHGISTVIEEAFLLATQAAGIDHGEE